MKRINDVYYTAPRDSARMLDLYLPEHTDHFPVFVYFHGGGLEAGSRKIRPEIARDLTAHGVALASVEYRMYPTAHYPDFIEDAAAAVAYVKAHAAEYGIGDCIFVGGSSAGGYLSMMLCFDERYLGAHGIRPTELAGFIHDAGQPTSHFNVLRERGLDSRRLIVDESAPLYYVGLAKHYPPMQIIVADNDMENRPEQTALLVSTLRHFKYDQDKIELLTAHANHCQYVDMIEPDGSSRFAHMVMPFILKYC